MVTAVESPELDALEAQIPESTTSFSFEELKNQVMTYLKDNDRRVDGAGPMLFKTGMIVVLWAATYLGILWLAPRTLLGALGLTQLLVFWTLALELGVMHDASHRSLTPGKTVNHLVAMSMTMVGASSVLWYHKHVMSHHVYTNIPGQDPDIYSGGLFRFHTGDKWHFWHRFQHWYALPLYSLVVLRWVWIDDIKDTVRNTYRVKGKNYMILWAEVLAAKAAHALLFLLIPYIAFGSIGGVLLFYFSLWTVFALAMAVIFQLAHVTDVQDFPESKRSNDWAVHQLATTANFATHNRFLTWLIGGLNYQVEHHIFPRLCHIHYRHIRPIVKQYCESRGVPYFEEPSIWSAVKAHMRQLKSLARKPALA